MSRTGRTPARPVAGFTLVELLVVIVVISVVSSVALLALPGRISDPLERSLEQLSAGLDAACERALLSGDAHGVAFSAAGYQFEVFRNRQWLLLPGDQRPQARQWPERVRVRMKLEGRDVTVPATPKNPQMFCTGIELPAGLELTLERVDQRAVLTWPL